MVLFLFIFSLQKIVENIQEFDSYSSSSSPGNTSPPHPSSPPSPTLPPPLPPHTSTPATALHPSLIGRNFPALSGGGTPEYMSIATPPSSPDVTTDEYVQRPKTSDWIKLIPTDTADTTLTDLTRHLNDTVTEITPHHHHYSEHGGRGRGRGRRRGRGRGRRVVPGGLTERLQLVAQRESSEVAIWEHRARSREEGGTCAGGGVEGLYCVAEEILQALDFTNLCNMF